MLEWLKNVLRGTGAQAGDGGPEAPPLAAPFDLVPAAGRDAARTWRTLRRPGLHPVLLGDREAAEGALEVLGGNEEDGQEILAAGLALDVDAWIRTQRAEDPEHYAEDLSVSGEVEPNGEFTQAADILTGKPHREVLFALVPVDEPWQVPAQLKPGGWNDCPPAHVHLAFFKRWHERYGAVVTTVTNDVIEFSVERPPTDAGEAMQLAREQFVYCPDVVDQGVQTIGNLAAVLRGSRNWYFWWD